MSYERHRFIGCETVADRAAALEAALEPYAKEMEQKALNGEPVLTFGGRIILGTVPANNPERINSRDAIAEIIEKREATPSP